MKFLVVPTLLLPCFLFYFLCWLYFGKSNPHPLFQNGKITAPRSTASAKISAGKEKGGLDQNWGAISESKLIF